MNADRLLALFEPISEAPDAIARLRRFILDLAVRGKLVEQDPEDEPAEELLGAIYESMVLSGNRKSKGAEPLTEPDDIKLFEIPCSWAWVSLGQITDLITSGSRDWAKHYSSDGAIFVRMGNLSRHHYRLRLDSIQHVKPPAGGEGTRTSLQAWDVLLSITGDVGMLGLIPEGFGEAYINQHTALVRPCSLIKGRFLPEVLRSDFAQDQFSAPQRGIKNSFRLSDVANVLIPLPPLAEQHRIVAKVDELMALCDQLEAARQQREQCRERLVAASLQRLNQPSDDPDCFRSDARFALQVLPSLTTTPAQIKQLRQTILNLAVRGKLVEQDPGDEPVAEVLRRSNIEQSPKEDFVIPFAWEWVAVGNASESRLGKMLDKGKNKGIERPYLRNLNVRWFDFDLSDLLEMRFEDSELPEYALRQGDVLICEGGEPGRAAVWDERIEGVYFQKAIHRVRFYDFVDPVYFVYALRASADDGRLSAYFTGTGISHFTGRGLKSYCFPLPPLAEQHRIVAKVDELVALCDQLEQQLSQGEERSRGLLEAVLREALVGRLPERPEEHHAAIA